VARLVEAAGGDQAVIARELDKLALYLDAAPDRPAELTAEALDALVAERFEAEGSLLADALVAGDPLALSVELSRLRAEGASAVSWLRQLQRRLLSLAAMRAEVDRGEPAGAVMKRHRVFFREEAATASALSRWSAPELGAALVQVRAAERAVTASNNAGPVLAEAAALSVARARARRR
jgi:DNA polymerase-3 subunit delta